MLTCFDFLLIDADYLEMGNYQGNFHTLPFLIRFVNIHDFRHKSDDKSDDNFLSLHPKYPLVTIQRYFETAQK